jgi:hypothetical protein
MSFYVTVKDGARTGYLVGPFVRHGDALRTVTAARHEAEKVDTRAMFGGYAYGTSRRKVDHKVVGVLNERLGLPTDGSMIVLPDPLATFVNRRVVMHGHGPAPAGYVACTDETCDDEHHYHPVQVAA